MVAALRLSKRWEMWDMSSPRDPRRTDLYEDKRCRGKSRIRIPGKLHKILECIFYPKLPLSYGCFIHFHKDLSPGIRDTTLHLVVRKF